jgi:membrane protein
MVLFTLLFAALSVILPDAEVAWRDVWIGAAATAVLFVLGKYVIGLYIGQRDPGSVFGAAGSLAMVLLWVYYSAVIFLFGAELTEAWAWARGRAIEPADGSIRAKRATRP